MNRLTIIGFLGVAAVLSIGMLMVRTVSLQSVEHDSCISLIAATGHLGDYFRDAPRNRWVDAAQWQRLLHPDEFGCFGRITRDLCELDIHPPLYFWLLHLWIHLAGVSPESGPVLNGILMLMTTTVIYRLVRRIGISMVGSMAGAIFLLVNASSLETMAVTRQYTLLGLITAGMVSVAVNALQTEDIRWYVGLTILASAAFLTHFQSMVTLMLIAGGVMISVMHVPSRSVGMMGTCTRRGLVGIAAVGVGIGLVLLVFPRLMQPIVHQRSTLTAPMLWFSAYRWNKIGEGLRLFVVSEPAMRCLRAGPCLPVRLWVPVLLAALSVAVPMMFRITSFNTVAAPIRRFLLFTGLGQIVMVIVLYLSGDFPNHAMGGRYLMVPSVFAAVLLAMVTDAMIKKRRLNRFVIGGFLFIVVVNAIVTTQAEIITNKQIVSLQDVHDGRPVVTTAVKWGVLPMLIWDLDPDTPVYAAIGDALRHHPDPGVFMFPEICLVTRRSRYRFDPETSNIHMVFISRGYQSERCITHVRGEGTVVLLKRQGPIHPMGPDSGVIGSGSYVDIRCQSKLSFQHKHTGVTSGQPNTKQPHADSEPDDSICYPSQKRTP